MVFVQIMIFVCGCSAIWFVSRVEHWKRWGYIIGLIGQPFWVYSAYESEQWGILLLTLFYTYSWGQGIWNYWLKGRLANIGRTCETCKHEISSICIDCDSKRKGWELKDLKK